VKQERKFIRSDEMIIMDSREDKKLKKYFGEEEVVIEALPTGDYYIKEKNILVERKSMGDFISSYISHHVQEQCEQMEENFETYYLFISGHYNYLALRGSHFKYITEASVNKMKIHLLHSFPGLRIVEFSNDKQLINGVIELKNYTGSARHKELVRRQSSREDEYLSVLISFKGMSLRKAKAIVLVYPDIHSLINEISICSDKKQFKIKELNKKDFEKLKRFFGLVSQNKDKEAENR